MLSTYVTTYTGMSPLLSTMYLVMGALLSAGPTFAAHIPIMNDLFMEQNNILDPVYSNKYDRHHESNRLSEEDGLGEQVRVELKSAHVQRVGAGGRLELVCEANGTPPPKVQWFKGGELIQESGFEEQNDLVSMALASVRSRLVIDCVKPQHHGVYTCEASSGALAKRSSPASVVVQGGDNKTCQDRHNAPTPPRIITWSPVTIATIQGDIALPCNAVGNPMPEIYWKNQDNVNVANDPRVQVLKSGELLISKVHWTDMGEYTCVAISPMGRTEEATFLYPLSEEDIHFGKSNKLKSIYESGAQSKPTNLETRLKSVLTTG